MELENTPLWTEVEKIIGSGPTTTNYGWEAYVNTPEETLIPLNCMSVNIIRAYHDCYGDEITVTLMFGMGTFARRIFPFRDALDITLRKVVLMENQNDISSNGEVQVKRFKALLIGKCLSPTLGKGMESTDEEALNISQVADFHFQLQDKCSEQLRTMLTGGVCRKVTVQNTLTTLITLSAANVKPEGGQGFAGLNMVPADNGDLKEQIIITQGTRLIDLADFIQKRIGIYNAGIGSYIQNNYWYIFPLYDTTDFSKRKKTLTMLVVPERKLTNIERTFRTEADATTIIVTGTTAFTDDSGTNYQNYGDGSRFANAAVLMDCGNNTKDNKTPVVRKTNNSEFSTEKSGLPYAPISSNRITANPFAALSMQAAKRGGFFKAVWENSDHSLIIPGMATKIIYSDKEEIKEIYGIVHTVKAISHKPGGLTSKIFKNQTILEVFVNDQLRPLEE